MLLESFEMKFKIPNYDFALCGLVLFSLFAILIVKYHYDFNKQKCKLNSTAGNMFESNKTKQESDHMHESNAAPPVNHELFSIRNSLIRMEIMQICHRNILPSIQQETVEFRLSSSY